MSQIEAKMEISGLLQRLEKLENLARAAHCFFQDITRLIAPIRAHYDRLKAALEEVYHDDQLKRN